MTDKKGTTTTPHQVRRGRLWQDNHSGLRRHKLMTKELADTIPPLYANDGADDPDAVVAKAKLFSPYNGLALVRHRVGSRDRTVLRPRRGVRDRAGVLRSHGALGSNGNGQEEVVARAFDMGAADYVVKPFSPTELAARIRAALRKRAAPELAQPSEPYLRGDLTVDYARRRVTVAGNPVELTDIEYRMLVELSVNAGRALTHERLLQRVWGPDKGEDSGPVRNIVKRLRRKLGEDAANPAFIFAEPRFGYRMEQGEGQEREET